MNQVALRPLLIKEILFTDEATCSRAGITNSHNQHYWATENPHVVTRKKFQEEFSLNVWCGLIDNKLNRLRAEESSALNLLRR
jgi:hypothetical protein